MDKGLLDNTLAQFTAAIQGTWGSTLPIMMGHILQAVTFFQFFIILMQVAMKRDFTHLFDDLVIGGVRIGIIWLIFTNSALWGQAVIDTGKAIGQAITQGSPATLTPSGVLDQGINLAAIIWSSKGANTYLHPIQDLEFVIAWLTVLVAFTVAALVLLEAELEAAVLVYGGPLLIGFSPFYWTGELIVTWAKAVFAVAIKIAVILGMLAIGMAIALIWATQLQNAQSTFTTNIWNLMQSIVMAIVFGYAMWKVPHLYMGLIGGSPAFQFGSAFAGSMMTAGAGAAASAAGSAAGTATPIAFSI